MWRSPYTRAFLVCLVLVPLLRPLLRFEPPPPDPIFALPEYALRDSAGETFGSAQLAGKVYLLHYASAHCAADCARIARQLVGLRQRFDQAEAEDLHFVTVLVDAEEATATAPSAREIAVEHSGWAVLSGPASAVRRLAAAGPPNPLLDAASGADDGAEIEERLHSELTHDLSQLAHDGGILLVDRFGQVRGYYRVDRLGLDEVFHRTLHVLAERRTKRAPAS